MDLTIHDALNSLIHSKSNSRNSIQGGVVTERDALAMQWVAEQGAMTVDQLWRAIWWKETAKESRYAYYRISFLERSGILEKIKTPFYPEAHYRLTKLGYSYLSGKIKSALIPIQRTPIIEVPHVHILTEMRLMVRKKNKSLSWTTDRTLAIDPKFPKERLNATLPDAIWVTMESGRRIAVEYERTRKGLSRVRSKVEALSGELARPDRLFDLVLWIAEPGAYQDLNRLLPHHPGQKLRQLDQFFEELR